MAIVSEPACAAYLGACIGLIPYAGEQKREKTYVRLYRVAAFTKTGSSGDACAGVLLGVHS